MNFFYWPSYSTYPILLFMKQYNLQQKFTIRDFLNHENQTIELKYCHNIRVVGHSQSQYYNKNLISIKISIQNQNPNPKRQQQIQIKKKKVQFIKQRKLNSILAILFKFKNFTNITQKANKILINLTDNIVQSFLMLVLNFQMIIFIIIKQQCTQMEFDRINYEKIPQHPQQNSKQKEYIIGRRYKWVKPEKQMRNSKFGQENILSVFGIIFTVLILAAFFIYVSEYPLMKTNSGNKLGSFDEIMKNNRESYYSLATNKNSNKEKEDQLIAQAQTPVNNPINNNNHTLGTKLTKEMKLQDLLKSSYINKEIRDRILKNNQALHKAK